LEKMEPVELGRTGIWVSPLAIGTGTNGWAGRSDQTDLGFERLVRLLRYAYEQGITFWDSADAYGSHPHVAAAMKGIDRGSVVIATKMLARSYSDAERDVERFLRELQTEMLDIVLLHCITDEHWPKRRAGAMEALSRAKERGLVRAVGISVHSLGALRSAAASPWVDVVLVRLNTKGVRMDAAPEEVLPLLKEMHASGKGVYAMKVLGLGTLAHKGSRALRYVLDLPEVDAAVVGMTSEQEVRENISWVGARG